MSGPKLLVVSIGTGSNKEQRNAFTRELQDDRSIGLWHHVEYTWVIHDPNGTHTAAEYRDRLLTLMPGVYVIALGVAPSSYAAFSPTSGHQWLQDYAHSKNFKHLLK